MISEDNNDLVLRDDDGVYQPQQPLTFEKVWLTIQETSKMMKEQSRETEKRFAETARLINELREEYKDRWGELVKSLVSGSLLRILKERNFPVEKIRQRVRNYKGEPTGRNLLGQNPCASQKEETKTGKHIMSFTHCGHRLFAGA